MLITVRGRLVRSHGSNDLALPGAGVIQYQPATHGTHDGALRGTDPVPARIVDGEAEPVELTPGPWRVSVFPEYGDAWEPYLVELTEDMTEPVDLVNLTPVVEIDGEKWVTGPRGVSVIGLRDNGDGTVTWLYSDGTESEPYEVGVGPAGRGIVSVSDPDEDSVVTITYTDGSTSTVQAVEGATGPAPSVEWDGASLIVGGERSGDLTGPAGPANSLTVGTVAEGDDPAAEITGDAPEQVLHLTLARGGRGERGPAPVVTWDGSVIIVDDVEGPDLRGQSGIASVFSPDDGVWMIDQATGADADGLEDLQEAVYGKAEQADLDAAEQRLGAEPVAVTFVNNSTPDVPSRTEVIPSGWEQIGDGDSAITAADGKFTTSQPGLYLVALSGSYGNGTASGNYEYRILRNGDRVLAFYGADDVSSRSGVCALQLGTDDSVEVEFFQSSGETFPLRGNSFNTVTFTRIV